MTAQALQRIQGLLRESRYDEARVAAERLTHDEPGSFNAWFMLGTVLMTLGRPIMAIEPLRRARALAPGNGAVIEQLYRALLLGGQRFESLSQPDHAASQYREAVELLPQQAAARICLGRLLSAVGQYDEARSQLTAVLTQQPGHPDACAVLALTYEYAGDYRQAYEVLREALAQRPVAPAVALAYAVVAPYSKSEAVAAALLEDALAGARAESPCSDMHFALGKLYDRLGEFDKAFDHYQSGNRMLNYRYDAEQNCKEFRDIASAFSAARLARLPRSSRSSALPVFIVGMPRSGTTLIEQILASHPNVHGAGERDDIARIVQSLGGPAPAPGVLERLTVAQLDSAAQTYVDALNRLAPDAARVTDKMPHNFLALGYIDMLFPDCRIVHCVRDPRDTCLSIWFQRMTANHPYTSDLAALADYYRQYLTLMEHWKSVIRAPLLELRYEDLVENLEHGARTLVDFCGLEWSERCLQFHENSRVVSTPTYADVRRPVHDKSVGRWRHYVHRSDALAGLRDCAEQR